MNPLLRDGLYLVAAVIFIVAPTAAPIGLARMLQGLGVALILPATYALLPSLVGPRQRATAFGVVGVVVVVPSPL